MPNRTPCHLHVPHKDWTDDPRERENYEAIERWSVQLLSRRIAGKNALNLHIPNKGYSGDPYELENYLAIERWARRFQINCIKGC